MVLLCFQIKVGQKMTDLLKIINFLGLLFSLLLFFLLMQRKNFISYSPPAFPTDPGFPINKLLPLFLRSVVPQKKSFKTFFYCSLDLIQIMFTFKILKYFYLHVINFNLCLHLDKCKYNNYKHDNS